MIRNAKETDLEDILEIFNDAILNTTAIYTYEEETLEDRKKWFQQRIKNNLPVIVYEVDNRIAGFASFGPFRPHAAYKYTIEHSIYVHKEYRNRKIGSSLLSKIIEIAKEKGYMTMVGVIDALNRESIKVHEKYGFTYVGTIHNAGYKFEKWLDLVFYQLNLGAVK